MTTTTTNTTTRGHVVAQFTEQGTAFYRAAKGRWTQGLNDAKRYSAEDARILAMTNGHHAIKVEY